MTMDLQAYAKFLEEKEKETGGAVDEVTGKPHTVKIETITLRSVMKPKVRKVNESFWKLECVVQDPKFKVSMDLMVKNENGEASDLLTQMAELLKPGETLEIDDLVGARQIYSQDGEQRNFGLTSWRWHPQAARKVTIESDKWNARPTELLMTVLPNKIVLPLKRARKVLNNDALIVPPVPLVTNNPILANLPVNNIPTKVQYMIATFVTEVNDLQGLEEMVELVDNAINQVRSAHKKKKKND